MSRDLKSWLSYLESLHPNPIDLGLDRIKQVAEKLMLCAINSFVVTVAGTNGKGSCVALLEATLSASGYKVGSYTSPHLLRYNERIKINGCAVEDSVLCEVFAEIEEARKTISLTYFEFGTLAALLLFKRARLDAVILEVGMGGRLDAVNIIDPDLSIISTIALDHMEWLGTTREAIAREKAGIMRSGKPVISGDFDPPATLKAEADKIGAPLFCQSSKQLMTQTGFGYSSADASWTWWSLKQRLENLPIPKIDLQNAATALQAIEIISATLPIEKKAIITALQQVFLPGRFQIFSGPIQRIYDVAHNPAAAELLVRQLQKVPCRGRTIAVIAMLSDKDYLGTVTPLVQIIDSWHVAGLAVPRGDTPQRLAQTLNSLGVGSLTSYPNVELGCKGAFAYAQEGDRIIVFGSFYTVAQALKLEL